MGRTSVILGGALVIWGVIRIVIRPLWDDLALAAWKRKRPEVERFMRDDIFRLDLEKRRASEERLDRALIIADRNAESIANLAADIARVAAEQRAMTTVLAGIPLIAASIESVNDTLERMERSVDRNNDIQVEHGEKIATLSALIGEDTPGRRHHTRRATDPRIVDPDEGDP